MFRIVFYLNCFVLVVLSCGQSLASDCLKESSEKDYSIANNYYPSLEKDFKEFIPGDMIKIKINMDAILRGEITSVLKEKGFSSIKDRAEDSYDIINADGLEFVIVVISLFSKK